MDVGLVCDYCSAFSPMGAQRCLRCGESLSLDRGTTKGVPPKRTPGAMNAIPHDGERPASRTSSPPFMARGHHAAAPSLDKATIACPTCGTLLPVGHRFCFSCGARIPDLGVGPTSNGEPQLGPGENFDDPTNIKASPRPTTSKSKPTRSTMFFGAAQAARAKLTLIRGDGLDGVSFTLAGDDHQAGRGEVPLAFPEDPFLSPIHANFFYRDGRLIVRDEESINGVYLRIHGGCELAYGARFLVGEQVLEIQKPSASASGDGEDHNLDEPIDDGTYFFASPRRASNLRIVQHLRGGDTGLAYRAYADAVTIGREGNDIDFPDDPFISGHHARVAWSDGRLVLTDLSSRNGTFIRIVGERALEHGDYVFMGQQLLRVEIV